ncbi:hypothetical protein ABZ208_35510 [Streptomyces sp. NPDC006208]|uniref:hypothetical protein n=1 Tax=Streptomyces sp. NPDC006208 TaxID=3156734 RepID=UPI0033BCBEB4
MSALDELAATTDLGPARIRALRVLVAHRGGKWTPRRVRRDYIALGIDAPKLRTARRDLAQLAREGALDLHDEDPGFHYYTRKEQSA